MLERLVEMREWRREQGFIQDFQFGGGDVCGLTGMGSTFPSQAQKWC